MADKLFTMQLLLRKLARIPGLGFLSAADDALQQVDDVKDEIEHAMTDAERNIRDVQLLSQDLAQEEDD